MKFGKRLKQQMEQSLGEWRDKFLSYKELKKMVNLISSKGSLEYDFEFINFLNHEIDKFNAFFMEQEEDFIIRHKVSSFFYYIYFLSFEIDFFTLLQLV